MAKRENKAEKMEEKAKKSGEEKIKLGKTGYVLVRDDKGIYYSTAPDGNLKIMDGEFIVHFTNDLWDYFHSPQYAQSDGRVWESSTQWFVNALKKEGYTGPKEKSTIEAKTYTYDEDGMETETITKVDMQEAKDKKEDLVSTLQLEGTEEACDELMKFFSEFEFSPNYRFINTLIRTPEDVRDTYILNYFRLTDNPGANSLAEKIKCEEFQQIKADFKNIHTDKRVNKRLKIYFGPQGTGKTTLAMEEAGGNIVVCHSGMLPQDLMEDFAFEDGKPGFNKSALRKAMEEGQLLVLDEINLLPYESVRFLQTLLDNKETFIYKDKEVKIKEGFEIIGTMNLEVNGSTYALPEPLVDRAYELREFILTPKMLAGSIL